MISPKKVETKDTYLIVHFSDGAKYIDMREYLKEWQAEGKRLLKNITRDLATVYLEDGYAISWPDYNFSIDPEIFYRDATDGYPTN